MPEEKKEMAMPEEEEHVSYELFLHWKQGGDFANCLEETESVEEALRMWAKSFEANADHCRELADEFSGENIEGRGDTHLIGFSGDEEVLERAVEKDLIEKVEF